LLEKFVTVNTAALGSGNDANVELVEFQKIHK
jgi:hypothetical protein